MGCATDHRPAASEHHKIANLLDPTDRQPASDPTLKGAPMNIVIACVMPFMMLALMFGLAHIEDRHLTARRVAERKAK